MGMEQFGINVDVDVNTGDAKSKISELKGDLEYLEGLKKNGITLDLGLSNVDTKKIGSLIALTKSLGREGFSNAFSISEKSLTSLKQLKETAEQISKLNVGQTNLINESGIEKQSKEVENLVKDYKVAQKEIKALQTQLSSTKDNQVIGALGDQLGQKYAKLDSLYKKMNDSQKVSVEKVDMENIEQLERVYGKVFDGIQAKARKFKTELNDLSKSEIIDQGELKKTKELLDTITNMNFKDIQSFGFKPFSDAIKDVEKLQSSISELKKGSKLDGFNQTDSVKEWKNLQNIITSIKKDMAGTTNTNNMKSQSAQLSKLNKELTECYNKMSEVDKKTVETISKFDKIKLDNSFSKSAEGMLRDVKKLEDSLTNISKKGVFDGRKLQGYKKSLQNIGTSLNDGLLNKDFDEKSLSKLKSQIESVETSFKSLGAVAERELKINGFTKGMEKQLESIQNKFKSVPLEKEIGKIRKEFDKLETVPIGKLSDTFESINSKVMQLRQNAESTSKSFKEYDKVSSVLREVESSFLKLAQGNVFNSKELDMYRNKIGQLSTELKNLDLKSPESESGLKNLLGDVKLIQAQFKDFKMPDFLAQWKSMDSQLTNLKKSLSTAFDITTIDTLENKIKSTETAMAGLVQKMSNKQVGEMLNVANKSANDLSEYFRKQADKSIKEIEKIETELNGLGSKKITQNLGMDALLSDLSRLKKEMQAGIGGDLINANVMRTFEASLQSAKKGATELNKAVKEMGDSAKRSVSDYSKLATELVSLETKMSKSKSPITMDKLEGEISRVKAEMDSLYLAMDSTSSKIANTINANIGNKLSMAFLPQMDKIRSEASRLDDVFKNIGNVGNINTGQLSKLKTEVEQVVTALNSDGLDGRQLAQLQSRLQAVSSSASGLEKVANFSDKIENELKQLESSTDSSRLKSNIAEIRNELLQLGNTPIDASNIDKQMSKIEKSLKKAQGSVRSTGTFFNDLNDSLRTFTLGNIIGDALTSSVYKVKDTLIGIDSALRDMMKVAPAGFEGTSEQLKQVKNDAIETAKAVGTSSEDVIQGMAKALQTGVTSMNDALAIAKQSTILANVGDMEQGIADKYIASIMSAYGGMTNAMKPVRSEIQGMGKDYSNLENFIDQAK